MPATNYRTRIGVGEIELDAYGGDFSAATSLGHPSEDGVTVEYTGEVVKTRSGKTGGIREIFNNTAYDLAFECMLLEAKATHMALSFGRATADVTDNSGGSPANETFDLGAFSFPDYYALRLKNPNPKDPTLFDIFTAYRVMIVPRFNQVMRIGADRYVPVRFECTEDPANNDKYGTVVIQYDAGDLP